MDDEAPIKVLGYVFRALTFLVELLLQVLTEFMGYLTARFLIPLLSLGWVRVEKFRAKESGFNAFGFKRDRHGVLVCSAQAASFMGICAWLLFVLLALVARNLSPAG